MARCPQVMLVRELVLNTIEKIESTNLRSRHVTVVRGEGELLQMS